MGEEAFRAAGGVIRSLRVLVLILGLAPLAACSARSTGAELYPEVAAHTGKEISDVRFVGTAPFPSDTLKSLIQTRETKCSIIGIPVCPLGFGRTVHRLDPETIRNDVLSLTTFYRAEGYFGTRVEPSVEPDGGDVTVTFAVQRGEAILLDAFTISGLDGILDADSLAATLPLHSGQIFDLGRFSESADAVLRAMQSRGHAYAEILRNFTVDTVDNRALASIEAIPGPRVVVDSIIVRGADHLGRRNALRQLTFRTGDILQLSKLAESQRNLYALDLVQIAGVGVGPDSVQKPPPNDSSTATIVVAIAEAPLNQVDAAIGFGSVECLRGDASWLNRSFGGGARRLTLSGSLSKIGVGSGTSSGIGRSLCEDAKADSLINPLVDYRISAEISQPYFFSPRNQLSLSLFADRQSETGVFQREAKGGRIAVSRRLGLRTFVTTAFDVERGRTIASPALYCAAFVVCEIGFTDSLARPRFRNQAEVSFTHDRTDLPVDPTSGFNATTSLSWAAPQLGSEITFVRWLGQGAVYRQLQPEWIVALGGRIGHFFRTATLDPTRNFLPPEERFFAGGANTVRGYDRNGLGQGVWVTDSVVVDTVTGLLIPAEDGGAGFVPTGGTALAVVSAELRFPSPILSDYLRLAAFVDAGTVGTRSAWDIGLSDWRFTPGAGVRLRTPVGPIRVDLAYNPYGKTSGPLLVTDLTGSGTLTRVREDYRPANNSLLSKLQLHLGIGQAF
ncbi:MAG TPA: BamA/TamA family outer membrane protein [Longimicrobiales bacterium]